MSRTNCNNEKTAAHLQSFPSKLSWTHLHQNENAITDNEPNFNNENNAILIDVKPAATEGKYSMVPNRRAGLNARAGENGSKINSCAGPNKRAATK